MAPKIYDMDGQLSLLSPEPEGCPYKPRPRRKPSPREMAELVAIPFLCLDLTPGHGDMLGDARWEFRSPWQYSGKVLNTGVAPREPIISSLASILEPRPDRKYYLSTTACLGILRRAQERGKELPEQLKTALMAQAGLIPAQIPRGDLKAYHINQRDEGIDLGGVSGALMATTNMQMQTFVTGEPGQDEQPVGFDGYNGDLTGDVSSTLGVNCGMSTGRAGVITPIAFAANQRDEVRDLHDVAAALGAEPGMKQQTFISSVLCLNDQGGDRMDITEDQTTTLRAQAGGHQPLVLNDQGGSVMSVSEDKTGTLRAQEHGHQPLVFENHGIDARYTGPHRVAPTISARAGTGGNNLPLVAAEPEEETPILCITGNAIDRQPQNGGNGLGIQEGVAYTLTATDHHAVFSRQRVDIFLENDVVSTESARQHKDATDLIYQATVGALTSSDRKGPNSQYVGQDKLVVDGPLLIRRLTPLECERLQGFPDGWTDIPDASDSARYKALGNSVAIPCVDFIMESIYLAAALSLSTVWKQYLCWIW